jgi:hypothetical protein
MKDRMRRFYDWLNSLPEWIQIVICSVLMGLVFNLFDWIGLVELFPWSN